MASHSLQDNVNCRQSSTTEPSIFAGTSTSNNATNSSSSEDSLLNPLHQDNMWCGVGPNLTELVDEYKQFKQSQSGRANRLSWFLRTIKDVKEKTSRQKIFYQEIIDTLPWHSLLNKTFWTMNRNQCENFHKRATMIGTRLLAYREGLVHSAGNQPDEIQAKVQRQYTEKLQDIIGQLQVIDAEMIEFLRNPISKKQSINTNLDRLNQTVAEFRLRMSRLIWPEVERIYSEGKRLSIGDQVEVENIFKFLTWFNLEIALFKVRIANHDYSERLLTKYSDLLH